MSISGGDDYPCVVPGVGSLSVNICRSSVEMALRLTKTTQAYFNDRLCTCLE